MVINEPGILLNLCYMWDYQCLGCLVKDCSGKKSGVSGIIPLTGKRHWHGIMHRVGAAEPNYNSEQLKHFFTPEVRSFNPS